MIPQLTRHLRLATPLLLVMPGMAWAGPCTDSIDRMQARLDRAIEARAATGPFAPEGTFATRGYQPTPTTLAKAEGRFDGWTGGRRAIAALAKARAADGKGDLRTCRSALRAAERALELPAR